LKQTATLFIVGEKIQFQTGLVFRGQNQEVLSKQKESNKDSLGRDPDMSD